MEYPLQWDGQHEITNRQRENETATNYISQSLYHGVNCWDLTITQRDLTNGSWNRTNQQFYGDVILCNRI